MSKAKFLGSLIACSTSSDEIMSPLCGSAMISAHRSDASITFRPMPSPPHRSVYFPVSGSLYWIVVHPYSAPSISSGAVLFGSELTPQKYVTPSASFTRNLCTIFSSISRFCFSLYSYSDRILRLNFSPPNTALFSAIILYIAMSRFLELGKYLQTQSKLKIKVVAAGAYGSKIKTISVTADGTTYNNALSTPTETAEYSFTTGVLNGEGTQQVVAAATDSRGRSASVTVQIEIQSYNAPRITQLVVHRCNSDGTENQSGLYAKVTYSFSVAAASTGTVKLLYKKTQDTEYTQIALPGGQSAENESVVFPADDGSPYDIELVITDSYGSASRKTKLSTGYTIMHFPASGRGVTFGGVATRSGFNVNMVARFNWGLLYKPKVLNRGDCDSLLESGVYFIGNYGTGRPPGNSVGWLEVMSINDGYFCTQRYITPDFQCWIRYRMNETWEEWRQIFAYKEG